MSTASVGWCGCGIGDGFLVGWVVIMGECPLGCSSHVRMLVRSVLGVKSGRVR